MFQICVIAKKKRRHLNANGKRNSTDHFWHVLEFVCRVICWPGGFSIALQA
jgi:hypothetical protein